MHSLSDAELASSLVGVEDLLIEKSIDVASCSHLYPVRVRVWWNSEKNLLRRRSDELPRFGSLRLFSSVWRNRVRRRRSRLRSLA
jgi:hypothetical protein